MAQLTIDGFAQARMILSMNATGSDEHAGNPGFLE